MTLKNCISPLATGPALHSLRTCRTQTQLQQKQLSALEPVLQQALAAQREQARQQAIAAAAAPPASHPVPSPPSSSPPPDARAPPPDSSHLAAQLASALSIGAPAGGSSAGSGGSGSAGAAGSVPHMLPAASANSSLCTVSGAAHSVEPWSDTEQEQEPWGDADQAVTDAAKARLAAEDRARAGTAASAALPIRRQPMRGSGGQAATSPDLFAELFGLDDFGRVVTVQKQQPPGSAAP